MDEIKVVLFEVFKKILKRSTDISLDDDVLPVDFSLSRLNSIEYVSLVVELEEALDLQLEEDKLMADTFSTLDDFLNYLVDLKNNN